MEKVKVNKDLCIRCGACHAIMDSVFQFKEDGSVETIEDNNTINTMEEEVKEGVMDALEGCPTSAIYLEEEKDAA